MDFETFLNEQRGILFVLRKRLLPVEKRLILLTVPTVPLDFSLTLYY